MALGEQESRAIAEFCHHFGLTFNNPELLKLALTHRSYLSVTGQGPRESNERLEFLGDSVLGLVTSEYLYRQHPNEHEGQLTKTKSLLVSKAILSRRALAMGLGRFVLMSHSEVESGGRQRLSIIADAFESVVGAIYLDQGFEASRTFIERWLLRDSREIAADKRHTNYKSHLQEYVQSTFRTHPVYRIRSEMGPDHSKMFMVEVMVGKRTLGEGKGRNKKEAEQAAARDALESVQHASTRGREDAVHESEEPRPREARVREREAPRPREEARLREREPVRQREDVRPIEAEVERSIEPDLVAPESPAAAEIGSEVRRRSRRGRRGGRGRTGAPEGTPPIRRATEPVPAPEAPRVIEERVVRAAPVVSPPSEPRETREPRRGRGFRPSEAYAASEPELELPEIEPMPPAHEEDENEEVGRPEGPLEERHIDPYAVEPEPSQVPFEEMEPDQWTEEPESESEPDAEPDVELEPEPEPEPEAERVIEPRRRPESRTEWREPESSAPPPPPAPAERSEPSAPQFGRRSSRGRNRR